MTANSAQAHDGGGHGSVRSYRIGFLLSVILTIIPFGLVMAGMPAAVAIPVCFAFAAVQIIVHLIYFLHMNGSSSQSWNLTAFIFTVIIVAILVIGSLWVMYHMNANMMPGAMPTE